MDKTSKNFFLGIIIFIHSILFVMWVLGLFLIFYEPLQYFYAWFFIIIVGLGGLFLTRCPLTLLEDKLRKDLGKKAEEKLFTNRVMKKLFNFTLPTKLISIIIAFYTALSLFLVLFKF